MKSSAVEKYELEVLGAQESSEFKIEANGKAFKILIDGIYSNKIQAIVRELSSNAFDSHKMAGREDQPFDLYLPNLLDPTFTVRDYGTSLAHADVMGLYTTLFKSTKEDTNDAVGKFGLGSKTPFAYTDSFTVTAFMNGTKRVYGAYIAPNGMPSISLMASEDTSEPDGLMVSFPVNSKDCESFRYETERVLTGFDVTPNVKGAQVSKTVYTTIYEGSNFKIFKERTGPMARQGCVIYPIDKSALGGLILEQSNILNSNILIDFPIGKVDITASREALSYDEITIANILEIATKANSEIQLDLDKQANKARTYFEAQKLKHKFMNLGVKSASNYAEYMTFHGLKKVSLKYELSRSRLKDNYGIYVDDFSKSYYEDRKTLRFNYSDYNASWNVTEKTIYVLESSGTKKASTRIKHFITNNPDVDNVIWIKQADQSEPVNKKSLYKLIGYAPIIDVEQLPLPDKIPTARSTPITKEQIRVSKFSYSNRKDRLETVVDMTGQDMHYVYLSHGYFYSENNKSISYSELNRFVDFLGLDIKSLYIINAKQKNKVERHSNWINVLSNANLDKLKLAAPYKEYFTKQYISDKGNHWTAETDLKWDMNYTNSTSWKKLLDMVQEVRYADKKLDSLPNEHLIWLYRDMVGWEHHEEQQKAFKLKTNSTTLKDIYIEVLEEYPFLEFFNKPYYMEQKHISAIEDYIKLVDESRN